MEKWTDYEYINKIIADLVRREDVVGKRITMNETWKFRNISYPPGDYHLRMVIHPLSHESHPEFRVEMKRVR